jgi:hypothetical protein
MVPQANIDDSLHEAYLSGKRNNKIKRYKQRLPSQHFNKHNHSPSTTLATSDTEQSNNTT